MIIILVVVVTNMKDSKLELMLHPVRLRILQAAIGGRNVTAQQLAEMLPDVPPATLYRHLNKLLHGGILVVVAQNQVRGTTEKVYALPEHALTLTPVDLSRLTRDDHMRYFMTFVATLLEDYQRYLQQDEPNLVADGVMYRQATLYLSDEEMVELLQTIGSAIQQAMANSPGPDRRRRTLSTVLIPETGQSKPNR